MYLQSREQLQAPCARVQAHTETCTRKISDYFRLTIGPLSSVVLVMYALKSTGIRRNVHQPRCSRNHPTCTACVILASLLPLPFAPYSMISSLVPRAASITPHPLPRFTTVRL